MARSKKSAPAKKTAKKATARKSPERKPPSRASKAKAKTAKTNGAVPEKSAEPAAEPPVVAESPSGVAFDGPLALGFANGQSPAVMQYVARLRGIGTVPLGRPITYLELGCRDAMTAGLLAAALPRASVVSVGDDAGVIARGRTLAESAGLSNVRYLRGDLGALDGLELPDCDFISLHGVMDRVPAAVKTAVARFVSNKLKPGGLAFASYNAMPGWGPLQPLRRIVQSHRAGDRDKQLDNVVRALQYLKFLRENGAAFFRANPAAESFLDGLLRSDPAQVMRDYFGEPWEPVYFAEVGLTFGQAGLVYCGSTEAERNYTDLTVPETFWPLLDAADNDFLRENQKSLILNESFRRDLYCKPGGKNPADAFGDMVVGATLPADALRGPVRVGRRRMRLAGAIYKDLVPLAASGAYSVAELAGHPAMQEHGRDAVVTALHRLIASGRFRPFAAKAPAAGGTPPRALRLASAFNRTVLGTLTNEPAVYLASPVLGSAIRVDPFQVLMIRAVDEAGLEGAGLEGTLDRVLAILAEGKHTWRRGATPITEPAELRQAAEAQFDSFRENWMPLLHRFGILEAA